jgi:hypothetical protein
MPIVCETHPDHHCSPSDTQTCEEVAGTDLASEDGCRGLEDNVSGEEDEGDGGLAIVSSHVSSKCSNCRAVLTYLIPTVNSSSAFIPAMAALDKLERSISET